MLLSKFYKERKPQGYLDQPQFNNYVAINNIKEINKLSEHVYVGCLLSDFFHSLYNKDYTYWSSCLKEGVLDFKVDHLKTVFTSILEIDSLMGKLCFEILNQFELCRKEFELLKEEMMTDNKYYSDLCTLYSVFRQADKSFEDKYKSSLNDFVFQHWPDSATLSKIKPTSSNIKRTSQKSTNTPFFPQVKIAANELKDKNIYEASDLALFKIWEIGATYDEIGNCKKEFSSLSSRLEQFNYLKTLFSFDDQSLEVLEELKTSILEIEKAIKSLPKVLQSNIIVIESGEESDLIKTLKTASIFSASTSDKNYKDSPLSQSLRTMLRMDLDVILIKADQITSDDEYQMIFMSLETGHAIALLGEDENINDSIAKLQSLSKNCSVFKWSKP